MRKISTLAFASAILAASGLASASAQAAGSIVTYVSGKGADSGSCTPQSSPCRSFAYALSQTSAGGEIKALDPDGFGPVTITQSVSLIGVPGAGIDRTSGTHITINAGATDSVTIANLILDGGGAATNGIYFNTGGSLTIKNCLVQNFTGTGIWLFPSGPAIFLIANVVATANHVAGIWIETPASASANLDHVIATSNGTGVGAEIITGGSLFVTVVDSIASNNAGDGFVNEGGAIVLGLAQSTAAQNGVQKGGYGVDCYGTCQSAGNNFIYGNASGNVNGTLTNVGTQ